MKLKKLIENLPLKIYGNKDFEINGLCSHSKLVAPGNLFISKQAGSEEGGKYIEEAISSGARVILCHFYNPFLKDVIQLVHEDVSSIESELVSRFYEHPSSQLFMTAVTGTNGKTTISYMVKHLLDQLDLNCGLIGTVEYIIGSYHFEAELTTPDVITNHKLLKEMVKNRCKAAVMEVSSHGLCQNRVGHIDYDVAIFSNLSQDHLDYHKSMEAYAEAKALLFSSLSPKKWAVLNEESVWKDILLRNCRAKRLFYGFSKTADLIAEDIRFFENGSEFTVRYQGEKQKFAWNLIGRFNILNCLAALSVGLIKGASLKELSEYISNFSAAPGRLEKIENLSNLNIFVDYAHTPDALEQVLTSLNEVKKGKIITVFGCGGDRDREKRPLMGEVVSRLSDYAIITSDNPRTEDPAGICKSIADGFSSKKYEIEMDRRSAIEKAVFLAGSNDLILIAGKGHENYQIFSHRTIPFDDRKISQEIANRLPTAISQK